MSKGEGLRERVAAELAKEKVMEDLQGRARLRAKEDWDTKDLLQEAISRIMDPDDMPWDMTSDFVGHVTFAIRQTWYRKRRRDDSETEVLDDGVAAARKAIDQPGADALSHRARTLDTQRTLGERLLARLPEGSRARQLYELMGREDLTPADSAKRLHCTVPEVHAAEKQIRYYAKSVLEEWNASEERRLRELREQSTRPREDSAP
jgi:DNA-directed RNA polymerase specialized sigma24 family protein